MTPAETARLLSKAAAFDQRTIGDADVLAWSEALADLDYDMAMRAVTAWYRDHETRLTPATLRSTVKTEKLIERQRRLDTAHDERLRTIDGADLKSRSEDIHALARSLASPRGHNLTLRRRDDAGKAWAWSCTCGLNPPGQNHPDKTTARTAGREHVPALIARSTEPA